MIATREEMIRLLNAKIQVGWDQAERGELISGEESKKRMREYIKRMDPRLRGDVSA